MMTALAALASDSFFLSAAASAAPLLVLLASATLSLLVPLIRDAVDDPVGISEFESSRKLLHSYHFIVVGGGTAGAVVASRLSEDPAVSVLLLEAGGDGTRLSNVPMFMALNFNGEVDYAYKTEPDGRSCTGMADGHCVWHLGKAIGGTSSIDNLAYVRGNREDYDRWAELGNYGWSFDDVLPYFKTSENMCELGAAKNTRFHSTSGPITVQYAGLLENIQCNMNPDVYTHDYHAGYETESARVFLEAASHLGYSVNEDFNGAEQVGFGRLHLASRYGSRQSTAKAFLDGKVRKRANLTILLRAVVKEIIIENGKARGVRLQRYGKDFTVFATTEVILSAGPIASPQILMLSGVGSRDHLEHQGIAVKRHLPGVGANLQSHVGASETVFTVKTPGITSRPLLYALNPWNYAKYFAAGTGPLTMPAGGCEAVGFLRSGMSNRTAPDVQLSFLSLHAGSDLGTMFADSLNLNREQRARYRLLYLRPGFSIVPHLLHPKSRGRVRLRSRDIADQPVIEPNYYSDHDDLGTLVVAVKAAARLGASTPFRRHGSALHLKRSPGCKHMRAFSDSYWACAAKAAPFHTFDNVGTCKMGPESDEDAVVDPQLRVHGVKNLRVVDASVMPEITSGDVTHPTVMIAEKAADMIKKEYGMMRDIVNFGGRIL